MTKQFPFIKDALQNLERNSISVENVKSSFASSTFVRVKFFW